MSAEWVRGAVRVFDGQLTCCERGHEGQDYCDREKLVKPLLGLFGSLHRRMLGLRDSASQVHGDVSARRRLPAALDCP